MSEGDNIVAATAATDVLIADAREAIRLDRMRVETAAILLNVVDRLAELDAEATEARESANRWAYKMTLLVGWVKANCTPEQAAEARAASQVPA